MIPMAGFLFSTYRYGYLLNIVEVQGTIGHTISIYSEEVTNKSNNIFNVCDARRYRKYYTFKEIQIDKRLEVIGKIKMRINYIIRIRSSLINPKLSY